MNMTRKAKAIVKLLEKGYSPREVTQRMAVSYNYAWKLKKGLEKAAEDVKTTTLSVDNTVFPDAGEFIVVEGAKSISEIDAILNERGSRYGNFLDHATITYQLKEVARDFAAKQNKHFAYDQCEALDMIFHKLGRILNGDPNHVDSWVDIAGYAQLVADRLQGKVR